MTIRALRADVNDADTRDTLAALILHSMDGQDWTHVVLYPDAWTPDEADAYAIEVMTAAQADNPDEWSWEDYEPALQARGFVLINWHHGPTWDLER